MAKTTINDIAEALNISPSTVSRALAGNTRVSEATRTLIAQKAQQMGYQPNVLASSLRKGFTDTVGMIVPRINRQFFSNVISGAESVLNPAGYNLIICQSHERKEDEKRAVQILMRNQVSGLLVSHSLETQNGAVFKSMQDMGVIVVQFDRIFDDLDSVAVVNDNMQGAYLATRHLLQKGYKRIGHLAGDLKSNVYVERMNGYRKALAEAGVAYDESLVFTNSITRDKGFYFMAKALEAGCDALYCAGDYAALGVMEYAKHNKISIPNEFGLVGTANENFAELLQPSLTTIEQNAFDMGAAAADAFLNIKNGKDIENKTIIIPTTLKIRQSANRTSL